MPRLSRRQGSRSRANSCPYRTTGVLPSREPIEALDSCAARMRCPETLSALDERAPRGVRTLTRRRDAADQCLERQLERDREANDRAQAGVPLAELEAGDLRHV